LNISLTICSVLLPLLYLVETISWLLKAAYSDLGIGYVVAKTNIWLYGSRSLMIGYIGILYYSFESGVGLHSVLSTIEVSLLISSLLHILLLVKKSRQFILTVSSKLLSLRTKERDLSLGNFKLAPSLFTLTMLSVMFFNVGVAAPILVSSMHPSYSLTSSVSTQVCNAVGTILLLLYVEPKLYTDLDASRIHESLPSYLLGRLAGMAISLLFLGLGA
jgi:hypothetical protein